MDYEAPKYPRIAFDKDARRKLSQEDITEMKEWRERGKSYKWIGEFYGVSAPMAHYHTDPEWAKELNKKRYQALKKQLDNDPELAKKRNHDFNQRFLARARTDPAVKEFKAKHTYKWKKKKYHTDDEFREKTRTQAREKYYRDNAN